MKSPAKPQILALLAVLAVAMGLFVVFRYKSPWALNPGKVFDAAFQGDTAASIDGIDPVAPDRVLALFPEARGRAIVLAFGSEYCLDCKRLHPLLDKALDGRSRLYVIRLDIRRDLPQYPEVFKAFKPRVVPTTVLIDASGVIQSAFTGVPGARELNRAIQALEHPAAPPHA